MWLASLRSAAVAALFALAGEAMAQDACPKPGQVRLPLSEAFVSLALNLENDYAGVSGLSKDAPLDQRVARLLADASGAERDASLLALLHWQTTGTLPLFGVTMHRAAPLFDTHLALLDRQELTEAARAMRDARAAFPVWNVPAKARYAQWSDGKGRTYRAVDVPLRAASARFAAQRPALITRAEQLAAQDKGFEARLRADLAGKSDFDRFSYLARVVMACLPKTDDAAQRDAAFGALPQALRDAVVAQVFIWEAGNGSAHQYFYNSSGEDAPRFLALLKRLGLETQAAEFAAAMALLGGEYPLNTQDRRARMAALSEAENDALAQPTWIMDTDDFYDALFGHLKAAEYWPE